MVGFGNSFCGWRRVQAEFQSVDNSGIWSKLSNVHAPRWFNVSRFPSEGVRPHVLRKLADDLVSTVKLAHRFRQPRLAGASESVCVEDDGYWFFNFPSTINLCV